MTTTTGADIALDGDLLAIIETLFQEVTARRELDRSYEDMMREIRHLIGQMTEKERRDYLAESLFHNTVRFENERLATYMQKLAQGRSRSAARRAPDRCSAYRPTGTAAPSGADTGSAGMACASTSSHAPRSSRIIAANAVCSP